MRRDEKYSITISNTSDGLQDYMQIISEDQFSTNIVLIGKFTLKDARTVKQVSFGTVVLPKNTKIRRIEVNPKKT